ncbi:SDR family NAD(P)-dependent oxidoreductase [Candidatus Foliamicus sp.]
MRFDDQSVVITGAAGGLGQAYAVEFARRGARLMLCDLKDCSETAELVKEAGGKALTAKVDVTSLSDLEAMATRAAEAQGRIDVLVNNAALWGNLKLQRFDQVAEELWDATMAVNVKGVWLACRAAAPHMQSGQGGSIINIASLAATYGMANVIHYTTSKAAVIGLTRGLAREMGRYNVRVNAVAPNIVSTPASADFFGDKLERAVGATTSQQAIRKPLETGDVVGAVLWLASDLSGMTTGQTLMVDGGVTFL